MDTMLCYYCPNNAKYVQIIKDFGAEGPIDYNYYVCEDHRGVNHHSSEGIDLWKKNVMRQVGQEDKELLDRLGSDYDEDGIPYWDKREDR